MAKLNMSLRRVHNSAVLEFCGMLLDYSLPLIIGGALGWLCAVLVGYAVMSKTSELRSADIVSNLSVSQKSDPIDDGLTGFIFANPFSVTAIPAPTEDSPKKEEEPITGSLANAILRATFPDLGAWLEDNEKSKKITYLSIGEIFDSYKLETVTQNKAIFRGEDGNSVTKFLYLATDAVAENSRAAAARESGGSPKGTPSNIANQVTAAKPGGNEGVVARDVVNQLLMNPFDEMNKFRIRPKFEGEQSVGIEVQWIKDDSILGSLGVKENDVIKSVNGIPIKNMGDVANAINSLMNGTRFDVELKRGEADTSLTYVVK